MRNLSDFDDVFEKHPFDISREITFRATSRSLGLLSIIEQRSVILKSDESELMYLDFFRALMIISNNLNYTSPKNTGLCADYFSRLSKYNPVTPFSIAFRAALACNLPNGKERNRENIRRCVQSILDNGRNYATYLQCDVKAITDDVWKDFLYHIKYIINGKTGELLPPLYNTGPFLTAWKKTARRLLSKNETWNVWIEWFDYRLLGKPGDHIPTFLWKEIEQRFCVDQVALQSTDAVEANARFANICLESLEELVDHQSETSQVHAGLEFEVSNAKIDATEPNQRRSNVSPRASSAIEEVVYTSEIMLKECEANSASYLKPIVERYRSTFPSNSEWDDDVQLVMRGDAVRKAFEAQTKRKYDSDLPELTEATLQNFRQMIRAHNALISLNPEMWELDEAVSTARRANKDDAYEGLRRIVHFAETQRFLKDETRETLVFLLSTADQSAERDALIAEVSVLNFVKAASAWIWKNKAKVVAAPAGALTAGYALGQWMLANESWLLSYFSIDSMAGALIRAVLQLLKGLPLA